MKPKISVVMAVYNSMPDLRDSVGSIQLQTFKDYEFIIVDDCSTDGGYSYLQGCAEVDKRIRLYRNSKNVGLTRSLSRAMQYVEAPLVARMDADDISEPHRLLYQGNYMVKNDLTLTGSDAQIINDDGKLLKIKRRLRDYIEIQFYAMLNNPFMHTSVMFKKDCYDKLNGYNNRISYAQDYHLWARWVQQFKAGNISETLVKWRQSRKGISTTHTSSQKNFADKICVSYIRSVYPELKDISDADIVAMRNGGYNRSNIVNIDKIFDTAVKKFNSEYTRNWVECYKTRTQNLRG
jgi:glycosyltransferase involved in cell wall biosynthesis